MGIGPVHFGCTIKVVRRANGMRWSCPGRSHVYRVVDAMVGELVKVFTRMESEVVDASTLGRNG